jgi:nicotinamidase-related amidase
MVDFLKGDTLLVIDMLNDFIKEGGSLVVPGAERIIPRIRELIDSARAAGAPVIYVTDAHRPDDKEFDIWAPHAVPGTWGGEVIGELAPEPGEHIVRKRRYSAFFGTDLELRLSELGIRKLYLTGVLTNICVYFTAADGKARNYEVAVVKDAVASLSEETDRFIFEQMQQVLQAELV